jgi:2-dehydropantoate 2-reductase
MRIAILGAGGVGGNYGGTLARAGNHVTFLARGANLEALRERGLTVRTPDETFTVSVRAAASADEMGPVDLALVAVKGYSLAEIVPSARLLAERGATILPFLNGVEAADRLIAGGVPRERVLGGLTSLSVVRTSPGVVERRTPFQLVTVGELDGGVSERAERIGTAFRDAGAEVTVSADIAVDLWRKLAFISSMAAACGLARAPVGLVRDAPWGRLLFARAVAEVFAVARARGVAVGEHDPEETLRFIDSLAPGVKPSFLLDLEAGGPTELEDLSGAVSRLGREAGIETPIHDTATAALSAPAAAGDRSPDRALVARRS